MDLVPMPESEFRYYFVHADEVTFRRFKTDVGTQPSGYRDAILPDRSGVVSPEQVAQLQLEARRLRSVDKD